MKAIPGKRYRHYKGGEYTILTIARMEGDPNVECVVYRAEYESPDFGKDTVWIREKGMFEEKIMVDGKEIDRFTCIE
jgi:hypothetical protein